MKVLWMAVNTTCLEPEASNIVDISAALQVDGIVVEKLSKNVKPVFHETDDVYGKRSVEEYLTAYHNWLPSTDPRFTVVPHTTGEGETFFYSKDTLRYLNVTPEQLCEEGRAYAKNIVIKLLSMLSQDPDTKRKWVLAGHNVAFVSSVLQAWAKRCDKKLALQLKDLIDYPKSIDTMPFFKVLASFDPSLSRKGFGLKELAGVLGQETRMSAESKLDGLMKVVGNVVSGGVKTNEHSTSGTLPS